MLRHFLLVLGLGLLIHLVVGNPIEVIVEDAFKAAVLFWGIPLSLSFLILAVKLHRADSNIYERNRKASLLCRKVKRGKELTSEERMTFDYFRRIGVIVDGGIYVHKKTNEWRSTPKLSDSAIDDVLG